MKTRNKLIDVNGCYHQLLNFIVFLFDLFVLSSDRWQIEINHQNESIFLTLQSRHWEDVCVCVCVEEVINRQDGSSFFRLDRLNAIEDWLSHHERKRNLDDLIKCFVFRSTMTNRLNIVFQHDGSKCDIEKEKRKKFLSMQLLLRCIDLHNVQLLKQTKKRGSRRRIFIDATIFIFVWPFKWERERERKRRFNHKSFFSLENHFLYRATKRKTERKSRSMRESFFDYRRYHDI